jgi:endonuclease YncB( thermonuclease family)
MDYVPAAEVRVVDGDTFRLGQERIRILGIDTPETENRARCNAERRLAALATMTLKELIEGKHLSIQRNGKDRFGRTLAYVRIQGGADVGELLIRARVAVRWGNGRPDWCARLTR